MDGYANGKINYAKVDTIEIQMMFFYLTTVLIATCVPIASLNVEIYWHHDSLRNLVKNSNYIIL